MAEEETTPESETEAPPVKKSGKLLLVGGLAAGVTLGSTMGFLVLGPKLAPSPAHAAAKSAAKDSAEHAKKIEPSPIYQMDNLVLNPAGSGGTRFLLLSVALEVKDAATAEELKAHDAEMRDAILRLFGAKTVDQVAEASAREALREEVNTALSKLLPAGAIRRVYFPQFVIQ